MQQEYRKAFFLMASIVAPVASSFAMTGWADGTMGIYESFCDSDGSKDSSYIGAMLIFWGAIAATTIDKDLERRFTPNVTGPTRWVFRSAVVLFAIEMLQRVFDVFVFSVWPLTLSIWGALRCAQGLYLSGVAEGLSASGRSRRYGDDEDKL